MEREQRRDERITAAVLHELIDLAPGSTPRAHRAPCHLDHESHLGIALDAIQARYFIFRCRGHWWVKVGDATPTVDAIRFTPAIPAKITGESPRAAAETAITWLDSLRRAHEREQRGFEPMDGGTETEAREDPASTDPHIQALLDLIPTLGASLSATDTWVPCAEHDDHHPAVAAGLHGVGYALAYRCSGTRWLVRDIGTPDLRSFEQAAFVLGDQDAIDAALARARPSRLTFRELDDDRLAAVIARHLARRRWH